MLSLSRLCTMGGCLSTLSLCAPLASPERDLLSSQLQAAQQSAGGDHWHQDTHNCSVENLLTILKEATLEGYYFDHGVCGAKELLQGNGLGNNLRVCFNGLNQLCWGVILALMPPDLLSQITIYPAYVSCPPLAGLCNFTLRALERRVMEVPPEGRDNYIGQLWVGLQLLLAEGTAKWLQNVLPEGHQCPLVLGTYDL
ncbi:hypothetical protein BDK51DRAFT_30162 [Blyttiomyces helicus]|uniref:Uncharacterized protein n=1 Tax=Blyttiomyces helicus TaxID=388810 RepID=A0A4V1IQ15_9FUNG|nr:hypothetical protein BDK51DRAFT_30162 [Blyttiomyces helicus]|eukprot:RKO84977.1 hypothetical protein BDK51DRAFT_30162 [Blyttiomyces helicus]